MDIVVRSATPADAERFTALARAAKASWKYDAKWMSLWHDQLRVTPDYLTNNEAVAAMIDGVVVGCAVLEDHDDHCMMEHVWIDPAYQGRGIGRILVQHLLGIAKQKRRDVRLLADPHAERFYARLGAKKISEVPAPMPGAPGRTLPLMKFSVADQ
jgi:ribosomal protein S18 acetylase RimI-like enzyme